MKIVREKNMMITILMCSSYRRYNSEFSRLLDLLIYLLSIGKVLDILAIAIQPFIYLHQNCALYKYVQMIFMEHAMSGRKTRRYLHGKLQDYVKQSVGSDS